MPRKDGTRKTNEWAISDHIREAIEVVQSQLADEVSDLRSYWDERTEKWQESERGEALTEWIDQLQELVDAADQVEMDAPEP